MFMRLFTVAVLLATPLMTQAQSDPLKEAEEILRSAGRLPGGGGKAKLLTPPAAMNTGEGTWVGAEAASDTNNLTFILKANGEAMAYDDISTAWKGTWRNVGGRITINLTTPNRVNYTGTINGNTMSGTAGRVGGNGTWRWSVTKQ